MSSSTQAIRGRNPETASAIRTETVTGSHLFKIFEYSLTKGIGKGNFYSSDVFTIGGYNWIIEFYPDGYDDTNFICVYLRLKSSATEVKARFTFSILQQNGVPSHVSCASSIRTFRSESHWGFSAFVDRIIFEALECVRDDAFVVKCTVTVVNLKVINGISVPPSNFNQHFVNLLESGDGADVTFEVNGERFKAHRCVLAARSAVFKAKLFGCMKEKWTDIITVDDIEAPVFKSMLYFIYSDSLPDFEGTSVYADEKQDWRLMVQHLLVAADRYDLERLRLLCEDVLCKNLDVSILTTSLVLAEQHNCSQLKAECLQFLSSPEVLKAALLTEEFCHLMMSCPSILEDL